MLNQLLLYIASALTILWGIAHLFPTESIVRGFGDISTDNKRIVYMEWIVEGACLIFIGVLITAVTFVDSSSTVSKTVYWICFIMLNSLSLISLFTGFKIKFLPFRLCPIIFTSSSLLILFGAFL